jgi:hypothetical protein
MSRCSMNYGVFLEGQNLVVDAAGYGLPPERMEVHAADLMSGPVDAVVAAGDPAVRAAQRATTSIPILAFTDEYGRPRICELRARWQSCRSIGFHQGPRASLSTVRSCAQRQFERDWVILPDS